MASVHSRQQPGGIVLLTNNSDLGPHSGAKARAVQTLRAIENRRQRGAFGLRRFTAALITGIALALQNASVVIERHHPAAEGFACGWALLVACVECV
jgi:hypothetical protein